MKLKWFEKQPEQPKGFFHVIFRNFWLKVLSVLFAIILYGVVQTERSREYNGIAKIVIKTAPNMMVIGPAERAVPVTIKYPQMPFFRQPEEKELEGEINAQNEKPGKVRVRLGRENFPLLDRTFSLVIHDPFVEFEIDERMTKTLPVTVQTEGKLAQGYEFGEIVVEPQVIEVSGARRELSKITELFTEPLNVENLDKMLVARVRIAIRENSSLKLSSEWVLARLDIVGKGDVRIFTSVPIEVIGGVVEEMQPSVVRVELKGSRSVLETLQDKDVRVFLDVSRLNYGWHECDLQLQIPAGVSLLRLYPTKVTAKVSSK